LPQLGEQLPGAGELRLLPAWKSVWLVVASVPERDYSVDALSRGMQNLDWVGRRAMAHEAVVEQFLTSQAVLPLQLFTLFTSDERAVEDFVRRRKSIDRILARINRQHEWGLRLTFDERGTRASTAARGVSATGTGYLARRRDLLDVTRGRLADARAEAARVFRTLSRDASAARRRTSTERAAPGSRLLLDAAFLVPVRRATAFRALLRKQARAFRTAGIVVSLTGPWPPYNFI
jgi:hypothetical protein